MRHGQMHDACMVRRGQAECHHKQGA